MGNPGGGGPGVTVDIFVIQAIRQVHDLSGSRSLRDLRASSQALLASLESTGDRAVPGQPFLSPALCTQLVDVLAEAAAQSGSTALVDVALATLHKLIAYAFLQGESTPGGRAGDGSLVERVVAALARTAGSPAPSTQLALVRALLTASTAEHFVPHGNCLMLAVRAVFNLAVGAASPDIRATARSALLQALNAVLRRVGQQVVTPLGRTPAAGTPNLVRNASNTPAGALAAPHAYPLPGDSGDRAGGSYDPRAEQGAAQEELAPAPGSSSSSSEEQASMTNNTHPPESNPDHSPAGSDGEEGQPPLEDDPSAQEAAALAWGERVAHAAEQVERRQSRGEVAEEGDGPTSPSAADLRQRSLRPIAVGAAPPGDGRAAEPSPVGSETRSIAREDARTARMATMAERADLRGLEQALIRDLPASGPPGGADGAPGSAGGGADAASDPSAPPAAPDSPPDPRRALMARRQTPSAWRLLTTVERDAIIVLGALCRLGARELPARRSLEGVALDGKLLALELLTRVLGDPQHDWLAVRPEFAGELRAPLCLVLLRNCMAPWPEAVRAAVRLLRTLTAAPRLRAGLRAELGALYPLLLLRPLEGAAAAEADGSLAALDGLCDVCAAPQTLVDIFVNYDCSLQASNLFERTVKALSRMASLPADGGGFAPPAVAEKLRQKALGGLVSVVDSLDVWAGPIKSRVMTRSASAEEEGEEVVGDAARALEAREEREPPPPLAEELDRISSDKAKKAALQRAIAAFNARPLRGVQTLLGSGLLDVSDDDNTPSPEAVADFFHAHGARLRRAALGEYLGHHEEFELAVMRAYVRGFRFEGQSLDEALRALLARFRLPGEAQKIDRIMEAFAARFCECNPGAFPSADAAYLLAFAVIMLNTDAHNPMADRRIGEADFVLMATYQTPEGDFAAIAPEAELLELYGRIVAREIETPEIEDEEGGEGGGMVDGAGRAAKGDAPGRPQHKSSQRPDAAAPHVRLAAALGLGQLAAPFWAGAAWDKAHGVEIERRRLATLTREVVAAGGAAGNLWHAATHAEHARPMLQVCGDALARGLGAALLGDTSIDAFQAALGALGKAVQLAALLRLPEHLEALLDLLGRLTGLVGAAEGGSALSNKGRGASAGAEVDNGPGAASTSTTSPRTPSGSSWWTRETASLTLLLSLAASPEASFFGSAWIAVGRLLSRLDAEAARLEPPPAASRAAQAAGAASLTLGDRLWSVLGLGGSDATSTPQATATPRRGRSEDAAAQRQTPRERALAAWHRDLGSAAVDRLLGAESAALTGAGVVDLVRALCAASQEELEGGGAPRAGEGARPRLFLLKAVAQVAGANTDRIRVVWGRLWAMASAHLVGAACHPDEAVALVAADALRRLATRLLDARPELARWEHQAEALRPVAHVLRVSDHPAVRELAVACVEQVIAVRAAALVRLDPEEEEERETAENGTVGAGTLRAQARVSPAPHPPTAKATRPTPHTIPPLGSGWRVVFECLGAAACDPSPIVFRSALGALAPAVEMLFAPGGHACLAECAATVAAAAAAPARSDDEAIAALYVTEAVARRVASRCRASRRPAEADAPAAWRVALRPLGRLDDSNRSGASSRVPRAALRLALELLRAHAPDLAVSGAWLEAWEAAVAPALAVPPAGVGGDDELELDGLRDRAAEALGALSALVGATAWARGPGPGLWRATLRTLRAHLAVPPLAPGTLVEAVRLLVSFAKAGADAEAVAGCTGLLASALAEPCSAEAALAAVRAAGAALEGCDRVSAPLPADCRRQLLGAATGAVLAAAEQCGLPEDEATPGQATESLGSAWSSPGHSPQSRVDLAAQGSHENGNGSSPRPPQSPGSSPPASKPARGFASVNVAALAPTLALATLVREPAPRPWRLLVEGGVAVLRALRQGAAGDPELESLAAETAVRVLALGAARAEAAASGKGFTQRPSGVTALWWPDAYEEAVVLEALRTWLDLGPATWRDRHAAAWPALSALILSPSLTLRRAVQEALSAQLKARLG